MEATNTWPLTEYFASENYVMYISALGNDLSKVSGILDKKGKVSAKRSTQYITYSNVRNTDAQECNEM